MEIVLKLLAGAAAGAAVGLLAGRARICSSGVCTGRAHLAASMIGWAVFGAAVTWWAMRP
ncbi:MAG: hypothetical protein WC869_06615 [Phycisphaerae bacterium]